MAPKRRVRAVPSATARRPAANATAAEAPFIMRRTVLWGECDPAQMVYTPRFLDYVAEAVEGWFRAVLDTGWYDMIAERGIASPIVHASIDFFSRLNPGDAFEMEVLVEEEGLRSTIPFRVKGRTQAGEDCFGARLILSVVDWKSFRSISVPTDFRERIAAYRMACNAVKAVA